MPWSYDKADNFCPTHFSNYIMHTFTQPAGLFRGPYCWLWLEFISLNKQHLTRNEEKITSVLNIWLTSLVVREIYKPVLRFIRITLFFQAVLSTLQWTYLNKLFLSNRNIIFVGIESEVKFGHRIHMSPSHYILLNIILS